jgi:hypothetical protein
VRARRLSTWVLPPNSAVSIAAEDRAEESCGSHADVPGSRWGHGPVRRSIYVLVKAASMKDRSPFAQGPTLRVKTLALSALLDITKNGKKLVPFVPSPS